LTDLIDSKEYDTNMEHDMIRQIKAMVVEARKTNHAKGRATDDKISSTEIILMAVSFR
jgi:hypothetical protein